MNNPQRPVNRHKAYHAHIYFNAETLEFAQDLHKQIKQNFSLWVGRVLQRPVGPHTEWSFQILFGDEDFDSLIPWLEKYRGNLSVLIHADSGDDLADHTTHAYWLGDEVELDLSRF